MLLLSRLGVCLSFTITILIFNVGVSEQDINCDDSDAGYTLPCNQDLDPWKQMREKLDGLSSEIDEVTDQSSERRITVWRRIKFGREKVKTIVETPEKLSKAAKATVEAFRKQTEEAAKAATLTAEKAADSAKKATGFLKKGAKVLGALASAAQFVGPIMDIVLLFAPLGKSEELKAIESGFAKMGAKIDAVSYNLESIQGALDWNSIVGQLMEFEGNVNHNTEKYKELVSKISAADPTQELPLTVKGHIEDLVNAIRASGEIGNKLQLVDSLFKGTSGFSNGKTLLEMFIEAVDNDCSKILPMANKLISTVKNAQRLQYFYEINQKLVDPIDDKAYPKTLYEMYKDSIQAYTKCTKAAPSNAEKEMKVLHGNGESLITIIDKMESKYDLYNWMTMKEFDKEEENYALIDNFARRTTVELTGLSEDDKEKQRLSLFAVKKSSLSEVKNAIHRIELVLVNLGKADLPKIGSQETWDDSEKLRSEILYKVRNLLKKDDVLKTLIEDQRMSMVMFEEDSSIDLTGWHFKTNMEVLHIINEKNAGTSEKYLDFTLGFSFNFGYDMKDFNCSEGFGNKIDLSFEGSFPFCLCNMGYGGESCEVSLNDGDPTSTLSNSVLKMVQIYKVPGMFDLEDNVRKGTEAVLLQMENNKQQIFSVVRQTSNDVKKTENAILSAQSIMLNQLRVDNTNVLNGLSGLQKAMEAAFEKARNEMIYQTVEGQKVVVQTISNANKKVIDSISKLTGKVIENRYFQDLKLNIPVFQDKFDTAITIGSPVAEEKFSKYLESHEQNFRAAKEAAKKAIVEKKDSFVVARMQIAMVSGCTEEYTNEIKTTWSDLMELHLAMTTIQMWDLDFRIRNSVTDAHKDYYQLLKNDLEVEAVSDTNDFKAAYTTRSCPGFSMSELVGGGCESSTTYPGQIIPVACSDPNKSLILTSTSQVISEITCNQNGWAVKMDDLMCVTKCRDAHEGKYYDIGEKRKLPDPPIGYFFADEDGNTVAESTCLLSNVSVSYDNCVWSDDPRGRQYRGEISMTRSGRECQRWDEQSPHVHRFKPWKYWNNGLTANYCRNPDWSYVPWCYNNEGKDGQPRWEYCDVPKCSDKGGIRSIWSVTKRLDIDECATPAFCRFGGTCVNTQGSFVCKCADGYAVGEDGKCEDINECSQGNIGYQQCLVQQQLGTCHNTEGGFSCGCLAGSYTTPSHAGKQCLACSCSSHGVSSKVCDGRTGECLCSPNVGGTDCRHCKTGYTNYPYCTQCAAGYHGYPNCVKCSCTDTGVTTRYCNSQTGQCECKPNVGGDRCDRCQPFYKNFPSCIKDVKDGTLSAWSSWTDWRDLDVCGPSFRTGFYQERRRTRTCDDSTKNVHGRSCKGDKLEDIETRFHAVCKRADRVYITLHTSYHAGTSAELWMYIRQGKIQCRTNRPTWDSPQEANYQISYWRAATGCDKTFDFTKNVDVWLSSDSDNAVYITQMGAEIGGQIKEWHSSGSYKSIEYGHNNGWWTAKSPKL